MYKPANADCNLLNSRAAYHHPSTRFGLIHLHSNPPNVSMCFRTFVQAGTPWDFTLEKVSSSIYFWECKGWGFINEPHTKTPTKKRVGRSYIHCRLSQLIYECIIKANLYRNRQWGVTMALYLGAHQWISCWNPSPLTQRGFPGHHRSDITAGFGQNKWYLPTLCMHVILHVSHWPQQWFQDKCHRQIREQNAFRWYLCSPTWFQLSFSHAALRWCQKWWAEHQMNA